MVICWSDVLGGCDDVQSEEHYVSGSIVGEGMVSVSGLPFLRGETRKIPGKRLTRNMLCKHHNESLSGLDSAAGLFVKVAKSFMHRAAMRAHGARKRGGPDVYRVNGALVERWMLKTIVNLMFDRDVAGRSWRPESSWVARIHGLKLFDDLTGLYLLSGESAYQDRTETSIGLRFLTKSDEDPTLLGGQFRIEELQFALMMTPLDQSHRNGYRLQRLKDKPSVDLRQIIHFDWSDLALSGLTLI